MIPFPKSIFCMQLSALWGNERGNAVLLLKLCIAIFLIKGTVNHVLIILVINQHNLFGMIRLIDPTCQE